uniref:PCI domain-containing protein n=1 Tax=Peronospora matthiolae TaxID=2874970 RepID=A0AAV1VNE5_9STRA
MTSEEEYDFDYSDEDEEMEDAETADRHVQIENAYYASKQLLEGGSPEREAALEALEKVLELQGEQTDWGFKALKRTVKLLFELGRHDEALQQYEELLGYTKTAVTRNVGEKGINSILDYVSTSKNWEILQRFYETTLETLKEARNERLWFKTSVKLGNLLYEIGDFSRLSKIIKELLMSCSDEDAEDCVRKNSQLLEVYALQIQMYTAQKDNKKLVSIYEKALRTKSGVAHPKIIGVIHECGGKMYMMQREWDKARSDFFSGFKSYDEAGEPRRLQCLKYLVLANMLSESQVNVFDSQEAKPYENDKEIVAMTMLTDAFLHDEIKTFEKVLTRNQEAIMDDPFIKHYIDSLLRTIRSKVLLKIVKPYRTMDTQYIARELNDIPLSEVESLLSALVLDKKIEARIDQVHHTLVLLDSKPEEKFQTSIKGWCDALEKFHSCTMDRISTGVGM